MDLLSHFIHIYILISFHQIVDFLPLFILKYWDRMPWIGKQWQYIYHSSACYLRSRSWQIWCLTRVFLLNCRNLPFLLHPKTAKTQHSDWSFFCYVGSGLMDSFKFNHFPKVSPPNTIKLRIGSFNVWFWKGNHSLSNKGSFQNFLSKRTSHFVRKKSPVTFK